MDDKRHVFESPAITVTWSRMRCIHVVECVRGLPAVFQPGRRPWVDPTRADAERVAEVVRRCPTGALQYQRNDGGAAEPVPGANVVTVGRNGPLYLRGNLELVSEDGAWRHRDTRVALCRCGTSQHRPFCDGSHWDAVFREAGQVGEGGSPPQEPAAPGVLQVAFGAGGPLYLQGRFVLASAAGGPRRELGEAELCRCGASRNKPFCDGSHTGTPLRVI
jgi:CDGSH-type Zn-finger protein/uncharacterized Fe-S cluster protein YjdI